MPKSIIAQEFRYPVSAFPSVTKPPAKHQVQNLPPPNNSTLPAERAARSEERTEDKRRGSDAATSVQPGGEGARGAFPAAAGGLALAGLRSSALAKIKRSATPPPAPVTTAPASSGSPWLLPRRSYAETVALAVAPGVDLSGPGPAAGGGVAFAPYCNTGAQNTGIAQNPPKTPPFPPSLALNVAADVPADVFAWKYQGFLIDWLRFVVLDEVQQGKMLAEWRKEPDDWTDQESGHMGYRRCYRSDGVSIYYDHAQEGRGVCFDISGKGCRKIEATASGAVGSMWTNLLHVLTSTPGVHLTRLDAALDDKAGLVDLDRVGDSVRSRCVVSRFKAAFHIEKVLLASGEGCGKTFNFGSRESDMMVRMYNKAAEQKQEAAGHWVRVEVEAKDENAVALARALVAAGSHQAGAVLAGVLRTYITFREASKTDTNRSRWPVAHWWDEFLKSVEALRLAVAKQAPTLERLRSWLEKQVAPTLALMFASGGGIYGRSLLDALVEGGETRLRPKHHKLRAAERARVALVAPVGGPTGF